MKKSFQQQTPFDVAAYHAIYQDIEKYLSGLENIYQQPNPLARGEQSLIELVTRINNVLALSLTEIPSWVTQTSRYLVPMFQHLSISFSHLRLETSYGNFPRLPMIEFLQEAKDYVHPLINCQSKLALKESACHATENDEQVILQEDKANLKQFTDDPMDAFTKYSKRLSDNANATIDEFVPILSFLLLQLDDEELIDAAKEDLYLAYMRECGLQKLLSIQSKATPYLETIHAIERVVALFDVLTRGKQGEQAPPFYHNLRWRYHSHMMKSMQGEFAIFSAMQRIVMTRLIKVRGVPAGLVGIKLKPAYVDGHWQTPLEFWFHDFNHNRRMFMQHKQLAAEQGMTVEQYNNYCNDFVINKIIPAITITPEMSELEKDIRRIRKVILFEINHEEALPASPEVIAEALDRKPFTPSRFFVNEAQTQDGKVTYSTDPCSSILSFVFRKLEGDFYDTPENRMVHLGTPRARTRDFIADVARGMIEELQLPLKASAKEAADYVYDDSGFPLGFRRDILALMEQQPQRGIEPLNEIATNGQLGFDEKAQYGLQQSSTRKGSVYQPQYFKVPVSEKQLTTTRSLANDNAKQSEINKVIPF